MEDAKDVYRKGSETKKSGAKGRESHLLDECAQELGEDSRG